MSELLTAAAKPVHPADDIEPTPQAEVVLEPASPIAEIEVPPAPTLITEQEVVLSTAAAVPASRGWTGLAMSMRRIFVTSLADSK